MGRTFRSGKASAGYRIAEGVFGLLLFLLCVFAGFSAGYESAGRLGWIGTPGSVTVSQCHRDDKKICDGAFVPDSGGAGSTPIVVGGGPYHRGAILCRLPA